MTLRPLGRRRALVVALMAVLVAMPPTYALRGALVGLLPTIVAIALAMALRMVTRLQTELPDALLDERQRSRRNERYVDAYRSLAAAVTLPLIGVFFWSIGIAPAELTLRIDMDLVLGTYLALTGFVLTIPAATIAWQEPAI